MRKFLRLQNIRAIDVEGMYNGMPGDWVCHISIGYAGSTQIELVQHVSGSSVYADWIRERGSAVQHVAYVVEESEFEAASDRLTAGGYRAVQTANTRIGRFAYFDTSARIGVLTELIALNATGRGLFRDLQ